MSNFETTLRKIATVDPALSNTLRERGGFVTEEELPALERVDRMMLLLVRCGCGRFLAPAQNVKHFIGIIDDHAKRVQADTGCLLNANSDYVRDVSIPA